MASDNTKVFTDANFEEEVLNSEQPVLVDFWAEWCAPCRMIISTVEAVAEQYSGRAKVGKVNVDDSSLATRFNIRSVPTLLLFKNGQVQEQVVGATSKDNLVKMLEKYL